jgi:hypothetical protein
MTHTPVLIAIGLHQAQTEISLEVSTRRRGAHPFIVRTTYSPADAV